MNALPPHYEKIARRKVLRRSLRGRFLLGLEGLAQKNWSILYLIALPGDAVIVLSKLIGRFIARQQAKEDVSVDAQVCVFVLFLVTAALTLVFSMGKTPFIESFVICGSLFTLGVSALTVVRGKR